MPSAADDSVARVREVFDAFGGEWERLRKDVAGRVSLEIHSPHPRPPGRVPGPGAIAALHADARTAEETDWVQIVEWCASPTARPTARGPAWRGSTPPCPATPP